MDKETFKKQYQNQSFKHAEEFWQKFEAEELELLSFTGGEKNLLKGQQFLDIYGRRAKQLSKKQDEYSKSLLDDLIDFCSTLEQYKEDIIDVWTYSNEESKEYHSLFVMREKDLIIALVKTQDE